MLWGCLWRDGSFTATSLYISLYMLSPCLFVSVMSCQCWRSSQRNSKPQRNREIEKTSSRKRGCRYVQIGYWNTETDAQHDNARHTSTQRVCAVMNEDSYHSPFHHSLSSFFLFQFCFQKIFEFWIAVHVISFWLLKCNSTWTKQNQDEGKNDISRAKHRIMMV